MPTRTTSSKTAARKTSAARKPSPAGSSRGTTAKAPSHDKSKSTRPATAAKTPMRGSVPGAKKPEPEEKPKPATPRVPVETVSLIDEPVPKPKRTEQSDRPKRSVLPPISRINLQPEPPQPAPAPTAPPSPPPQPAAEATPVTTDVAATDAEAAAEEEKKVVHLK